MIDKHACSSQCPCQQGRDQAIAERVTARMADEAIAERVATRHLLALDVGHEAFTQHLKIHHYRGMIMITDMTNAGKRGKKVRIMSLSTHPSHHDELSSEEVLKPFIEHILHMTYDQAKKAAEDVLKDHDDLDEPPFRISEREVRGIDVEPMGTTIKLEKKFPNGGSIRITASPHDFSVINSAMMGRGPDPKTGEPRNGFLQDTSYHADGRQSGIIFYGWLKDNMSKAGNMTIDDFKKVWHQLGVVYDSH